MATNEIRIVTTADRGYLPGLVGLLASLNALHQNVEISVCIGIPSGDAALAAELSRLRPRIPNLSVHTKALPIDSLPNGLPVSGHVSVMTYARLLILHEFTGRVLYLDADTLVLRSLIPLWETDLSGSIMAAVRDHLHPAIGHGHGLCGSELPKGLPYFNAGVMLVDASEFSASEVLPDVLAYLTMGQPSTFWDQCALNYVLVGRWLELALHWNVFPFSDLGLGQPNFDFYGDEYNSVDALLSLEREAAIMHFVGASKPWQRSYRDSSWQKIHQDFRARLLGARELHS